MADALSHIEHIVVLMLENRSFDNILGIQNGLSTHHSNRDHDGNQYCVYKTPGCKCSNMTLPNPDPGELFTDMGYQLFEKPVPDPNDEPTMGGFVKNYQDLKRVQESGGPINQIMHAFTPEELPATNRLASAFGISDRWHGAAPCQTWPNRFFTHCATADGWVNNLPKEAWKVVERFPFDMPTIFNQFAPSGFDEAWRVYFHDFPLTLLLSRLWTHLDHFCDIDRFKRDVCNEDLPKYAFIEPRYLVDDVLKVMPNDQHPPYNVNWGEQLVGEIYNALRSNEALWEKTLLIVTYDEHGGCYDHYTGNLAPGSAPEPHPEGQPKPHQHGFQFDRYGPRVPAIFASPWVAQGSCHRAPKRGYPFDHTSIIATVREAFGLAGGPLTNRDRHAPSLRGIFTENPSNLGPERIEVEPQCPMTTDTVESAADAPLSSLQQAILHAAALLPASADMATEHLQALREGSVQLDELPHRTCREATPYIKQQVHQFLGLSKETGSD